MSMRIVRNTKFPVKLEGLISKGFFYVEKLTDFFNAIPLFIVQGRNTTLQVIGDVWWHSTLRLANNCDPDRVLFSHD